MTRVALTKTDSARMNVADRPENQFRHAKLRGFPLSSGLIGTPHIIESGIEVSEVCFVRDWNSVAYLAGIRIVIVAIA